MGNFPLGGGGPENFENSSPFFLFIFKHFFNHSEMKKLQLNCFSLGKGSKKKKKKVGNFPKYRKEHPPLLKLGKHIFFFFHFGSKKCFYVMKFFLPIFFFLTLPLKVEMS